MAARERLICQSADLVEGGSGWRFSVLREGIGEPAFAVRFRGRVVAYLNRCAHVGVELDWAPGEFFDHSKIYLICATHGALYSPLDGRCLGGRCNGRGLIPLSVEEREGSVYLMTNEQTS